MPIGDYSWPYRDGVYGPIENKTHDLLRRLEVHMEELRRDMFFIKVVIDETARSVVTLHEALDRVERLVTPSSLELKHSLDDIMEKTSADGSSLPV